MHICILSLTWLITRNTKKLCHLVQFTKPEWPHIFGYTIPLVHHKYVYVHMYIYIYADINIFMHVTKSNRNEKLKEWDKNIYNRHYDPPTSLQWIKFTVVSVVCLFHSSIWGILLYRVLQNYFKAKKQLMNLTNCIDISNHNINHCTSSSSKFSKFMTVGIGTKWLKMNWLLKIWSTGLTSIYFERHKMYPSRCLLSLYCALDTLLGSGDIKINYPRSSGTIYW